MARPANHLRPPAAPARLDRIDRAIVAALQDDVRLTNKELAARIGLAPSSCLERVRRLGQAGVLRGGHAEIDPHALGVELEAMISVQLRRHARDDVDAFWEHTRALPEVVAIYHVAGEDDFLVHVAVRGAQHLRDFALDAFTTRPEVAKIETSLIFAATRSWRLPDYLDDPAPSPSPRRRRRR